MSDSNLPENHIWVKGFEGRYSIVPEGVVYSHLHQNKPSPIITSDTQGYCTVSMRKQGKRHYFSLGRLMLEHFAEPPPEDGRFRDCHHIDGDLLNNHIDNLKWVLRSAKIAKGKLDEATRNEIVQRYLDGGITQVELSEEYEVTQGNISRLISTRRHLFE